MDDYPTIDDMTYGQRYAVVWLVREANALGLRGTALEDSLVGNEVDEVGNEIVQAVEQELDRARNALHAVALQALEEGAGEERIQVDFDAAVARALKKRFRYTACHLEERAG